MRAKTCSFECHLYQVLFIVVRCPLQKVTRELTTFLKTHHPHVPLTAQQVLPLPEGAADWSGATCVSADSRLVCIWLDPEADGVTVAHEALHAVSRVLRDRGLTLGEKSEEAFAYYHSWVMRQALEGLHVKF